MGNQGVYPVIFVLLLNDMKKKQLTQFSAIIALLFVLAPLAHAAITVGGSNTVDIKMEDAHNVTVKSNMSGAVPPAPYSGIKMEDGVNAKIEMKGGADIDEEGDIDKGDEDEDSDMRPGHATGTMRAMEMADEHALGALEKVQLHMDLRNGVHDEHDADEPEMDMAAKVRTAHDFEDFVHHKAKSDEHLKNVEIKDGKIKVEYEEDAKIFGFIGTKINARATVDNKDNVEVSYPWYHIFMKKHVSKASLQSNIARAIAAERKAVKEGMSTTTIEAKIEASLGIPNLFEIIANTLKEASVKAEADASVK